MSLQEPHLKMSKSHLDQRSRILITDSPEVIHRKVMSALTDSTNSVSYEPGTRPGVSNLLQLLSHFDAERRSPEQLGRLHSSLNLATFKSKVSQTISDNLSDVRRRYLEVMMEDGGLYLDHIQMKGAAKARQSADATVSIIREAVGL